MEIGSWAVGEACRRLRTWQDREETAGLRLSVNLGARELSHPDIVSTVLGAVRRPGSTPPALHRGHREHR